MSEIESTEPRRVKRKEKSELKDRMKGFLMFLPNMLKLLGNLLKDSRVPLAEKALFAAAIVYVIVPLDFIPDVFPFIGQVDDVYLVALTLLRLINRTDEKVVRENWSGGGDVIGLANSIAGLAPMLLPKRVSRVLSAEVELSAKGERLRGLAKKDEALIVEIAKKQSEKMKNSASIPLND
ncbi:MAG TPA: DUF1232 domain-containing protein [Pyrinomonadaceae bacterium]|jgi:uncharacterized membrane protein YkvA (DUF1232 family)